MLLRVGCTQFIGSTKVLKGLYIFTWLDPDIQLDRSHSVHPDLTIWQCHAPPLGMAPVGVLRGQCSPPCLLVFQSWDRIAAPPPKLPQSSFLGLGRNQIRFMWFWKTAAAPVLLFSLKRLGTYQEAGTNKLVGKLCCS